MLLKGNNESDYKCGSRVASSLEADFQIWSVIHGVLALEL